jgi:AcrR family transcriptional regulator
VVEALLTLNDEGNLRPTARDIAAQAGVSLRSLYVHFDDLEALFIAASQRHVERLAEMLPPLVTEGAFAERLAAFLARREGVHEFGAGVRRAALLQEPFSPVLQQALAKGRHIGQAEVRRCFAPEITAAGEAAGRHLALAIDVATSSATWDLLRLHQELSVDEATDQVRAMVLAAVGAWAPGAVAGEPQA